MEHSLKGAATDLTGGVIADCGHYVPEEQPRALLNVLLPFLLRN
jgi:pimeloyl-ACP methyl ester carboxylesterase